MTVKELREKLKEFPDNTDVFLDERMTEYTYGLAGTVKMKEINLVDEPGGEAIASDNVVIISEE